MRTAASTFCFANRFSLFSNMTPTRHEIVLEYTVDGTSWHALRFRYKVDDVRGPLKVVPPLHMPRLDWRLWLLAQGRPVGGGWFDELLTRLLDGSTADVGALLHPSTASLPPLLGVRARRFAYSFDGLRGGWVRRAPEKGGCDFGEVVWRSDRGEGERGRKKEE